MKRAWPYALALAVVVTGCYLALAPLLRSLSPAPTQNSASSQLLQSPQTITVSKTNGAKVALNIVRRAKNTSDFVRFEHKKKAAKKKTVKKAPVTVSPSTTDSSTGFAGNAPSTSTRTSTPPAVTPKAPVKTPAKTPAKKGPASVGGTAAVDQTSGSEGFAGGNSSGQSTFGQKPEAGN